jgi:hypothetical protein
MLEIYASVVKKVHKGMVRNTVFNQISSIRTSINLLTQSKNIKSREITEYKSKDPAKSKALQKQVEILENGIAHLKEALQILQQYKKHTTN